MESMGSKEKVPEDLGIKIGSKEEIEWTEIKTAQEETILKSKINIQLATVVLELANRMIEVEKAKFGV